MQPASRFVAAVAGLALSASVSAASTVYTSSASFMAAIQPGAYTETFDGLPPTASGSFSGAGFAYTLSAPDDIYASGDYISTNLPNEALTITFTSGNVKAVGGNFFVTDFGNNFVASSLTLTLSDATTVSFTPTSVAGSFRGFASTVAIRSLTIGTPGTSLYGSLDNLIVGTTAAVTAVPEPSTWLMLLGGLGLVGVLRRRA